RVGPDTPIGAALKDISQRPRPEEWLLVCPIAAGYSAISVQELARRSTPANQFLYMQFGQLGLLASPTIDSEAELPEAQALLGATGYVIVLRDDQPYGVLVRPAARPPASPLQLL